VPPLSYGVGYDQDSILASVQDSNNATLPAYCQVTSRTALNEISTERPSSHLGLFKMGVRLYDPVLDRVLTPDAKPNFRLGQDDINPYAYAYNRPVQFTDPSGFESETVGYGGGYYEGVPEYSYAGVPAYEGSSASWASAGAYAPDTYWAGSEGQSYAAVSNPAAVAPVSEGSYSTSNPWWEDQVVQHPYETWAAVTVGASALALGGWALAAPAAEGGAITAGEGFTVVVTAEGTVVVVEGGVPPGEVAGGSQLRGTASSAIQTPYALETQSAAPEAQAALAEVQNGTTLYRIGQTGVSMTGESQYWSLSNPATTPAYAIQMGVPGLTPDFVMGGTLAPGADVVTNPAAALGLNTGQGIQVVTSPGGVTGLWYSSWPP
jgi:RHS repeat-associated protein